MLVLQTIRAPIVLTYLVLLPHFDSAIQVTYSLPISIGTPPVPDPHSLLVGIITHHT